MNGFKSVISQFCTNYEREDSDDAYGSWEESYSNSFSKLKKVSEYPDVVTSLDINVGDGVFVVWAQYSTGDSFGTSYCGEVETIGVFKEYHCACELAAAIELSDKNESSSVKVTTSDGQVFEYYTPWSGYSENLVSVEIEHTVVL